MKSKKTLVFLHGFLGDPFDWEKVIDYLVDYTCIALKYPFKIPPEGILIGYSMGGRIALRYPYPKILISTHPGLSLYRSKEDLINQRLEFEKNWLEKLETLSFPDFLQDWYDQPLFGPFKRSPFFTSIFNKRLAFDPKSAKIMLKTESLSHSREHFFDHTQFIYGELDSKFKKMYQDLHIPALMIPKVGHVCHLEDPKVCAKTIEKALNLISINNL